MATSTSSNLVHPEFIAHFGLRTTPDKFDEMVRWHCDFFGGRVVYEDHVAVMITFDDEHHRLNILKHPAHQAIENKRTAVAISHIAFHLKSLADLATSYEQKKARGILPHWPVNHGMSTSMYYFDPDGNEFELQVDNFHTAEEAHAWMATEEFRTNSIGVDIVPDDFVKRVRSGEPEELIKKRPVIGQRKTRWENSIYFKPEDRFAQA